ncbi:glutamate receptor ionotropic, delta-1-like [Portunus trituberculatus]|uniref:glutamate receptor ionotropic, delta-1-like n=1 Tax=Portunus trituberculatus TaxID=210409 RepID=UPI001E1CE33C|nr:glutamate receptor ionotropic, delta-1-like [Portunus trituberculatus]
MVPWTNSTDCLKIVVYVYYPFIFMSKNGPPYKVTGSMTEVLDIIAKNLNFCYEYVVPEDNQYGYRMVNGSWTGIIGVVARKEADMTAVVVGVDQERAAVVDFSDFLYTDQKSIVYKRPMLESDMAGFLKPYTAMSWVMIMVALVTVAVMIPLTGLFYPLSRLSQTKENHNNYFAAAGSRRKNTVSSELQDAGFWSFATALAQCESARHENIVGSANFQHLPRSFSAYNFLPRGQSQQAVLGMWLVLSLIISTVYRSNLKAMLIKPRLVLPFSNLMELTESGIPCFVVRGTLLHRNIQGAEVGSAVWRLNNRLILHSDVPRAVRDMSAGKHAIFTTHLGLLSVIHTSFVQTNTCSIYMTMDSYFGPRCLSIVFRKGSPLRHQVNPIVVKLRESGILEHLFMKYVIHASTCLRSDPANVENILRPLEIGDMYGVCFVYVGGK